MISSRICYQSMGLCFILHTLALHKNIQSLLISREDRTREWIYKQNKRKRICSQSIHSPKLSPKEKTHRQRISSRYEGILMANTTLPPFIPLSSTNKSINSHHVTQEHGEPPSIVCPYIMTRREPSSEPWNVNNKRMDSAISTYSKWDIDIQCLDCLEGILC
jgi:hypothetical protein